MRDYILSLTLVMILLGGYTALVLTSTHNDEHMGRIRTAAQANDPALKADYRDPSSVPMTSPAVEQSALPASE